MTRTCDPNFTYAMKLGNGFLGPEYDVEVVAEASIEGGEPAYKVIAVYLDAWHRDGFRGRGVDDGRVDLLSDMDPFFSEMGKRIAAAALEEETFTDALLDEAGITYRGLGGNDPDGHWVQRRDAAE